MSTVFVTTGPTPEATVTVVGTGSVKVDTTDWVAVNVGPALGAAMYAAEPIPTRTIAINPTAKMLFKVRNLFENQY